MPIFTGRKSPVFTKNFENENILAVLPLLDG